jgi:sirohydrochlorin ferrochelatase
MRKAILIIDRGSKEHEVREELFLISQKAKEKGGYVYSNYCFLEVVPPYIEEGIKNCVNEKVDLITVLPYFLYPGMKLKDAVQKTAEITKRLRLKLVITKPLCYSEILPLVIRERLTKLKKDYLIKARDSECDVLVIGHGSSDRRAREAFIFTIKHISQFYRNVEFCFLELDQPNIEEGIKSILKKSPRFLLIMPYFLHKGIHIKKDIRNEIRNVLQKHPFSNTFIADHIGVDEKMITLLLDRAKEVEKRIV